MLETYFIAPKTLRRLRSGPSGPYIDGFATCLKSERYTHATAIRYLRSATHLGHFVASQGHTLGEVTQQTLYALQGHLPSWRCPQSNGGHVNHLNARTIACRRHAAAGADHLPTHVSNRTKVFAPRLTQTVLWQASLPATQCGVGRLLYHERRAHLKWPRRCSIWPSG